MKRLTTLALVSIGLAMAASAFGQATTPDEAAKTAAPKVYHAGGRHDRVMHENALRAKASHRMMAEPAMHAGGKHDTKMHEAAIRAQKEGESKQSGTPAATPSN